jgi:hypothetical protein
VESNPAADDPSMAAKPGIKHLQDEHAYDGSVGDQQEQQPQGSTDPHEPHQVACSTCGTPQQSEVPACQAAEVEGSKGPGMQDSRSGSLGTACDAQAFVGRLMSGADTGSLVGLQVCVASCLTQLRLYLTVWSSTVSY